MSETQATNPDTATVTNLDNRGADVIAELMSSPDAEGPADFAESPEKSADNAKDETPAEAPAGDAEARRAERKARLDELRAKDQAKLAAKQQRASTDEATARLSQLEKELADTKARAARLDRLKDPEGVIQTLREEGVSAELLGEFLRTGGDPADLATKRARAELAPEIEAIRKQQEADRAELAALRAEREQERAITTQQQAASQFLATATNLAADFPLASKWRERRGDEQLIAMAQAVGPTLPADATYTDLLGLIEEQLEDFASLRGAPSPATKSPKTPAAAKAPALTNRHAASSSVVNDEESSTSLDERARQTAAQIDW